MSTAQEYVGAIFRRARIPLAPTDFHPDWADQPLRHKVYTGVTRFPLPDGLLEPAADDGRGASFTLPSMAGMLRHSYGLLNRRLRVTGNADNGDRPWYRNAIWSRGTASGGGLYPAEIYWVCGPDGPAVPGIYHYSTPHHAMHRLIAGDVTGQVRAALPGHPDAGTGQFLLVTVKFWKNSFKYNSFCYHVVTMDVGALLGTWQAWAAAMGVPLRTAFWYDESSLDRLLGLDPRTESVLAVVPLPWTAAQRNNGPDGARSATSVDGTVPRLPDGAVPRVTKDEVERSQMVISFPLIEQVHLATMVGDLPRPGSRALDTAAVTAPSTGDPVTLPPPDLSGMTLGDMLRNRRSSFGAFTSKPPLPVRKLGTLLAAGGTGRELNSDLRDAATGPPLCRLAVFVNHVHGLAAGVYHYDARGHALRPVPGEPPAPFLQRQYFLNNYNLEQAAAVLTVLVRPDAAISAIGDRAYRLVNAEVGAVAEAIYLAAASIDVGCGAALGFDNVSLRDRLGLDGTDEWPALLLLVGNERADRAEFDDRLVAVDGGAGGGPR